MSKLLTWNLMLHDLISSNGFYFQFHLLERPVAALLYSTLHSQLSPLRFLGLLSDFPTKGSALIYWQIYNFWLSFEYSMFHFYNLLQMVFILPTTNILFHANNKYLYFHANDEKLFFVMPSKKFRQFFLCQTKKCAAEKYFRGKKYFPLLASFIFY